MPVFGIFLIDKIILLSILGKTTKPEPFFKNNLFKTSAIAFVFGFSISNLSKIKSKFSFAFTDKTINKAFLLIFLGILFLKTFSVDGPKVTPPPLHIGDRIEPTLALPVPFCLQGFLPPPRTSARVFTLADPCL